MPYPRSGAGIRRPRCSMRWVASLVWCCASKLRRSSTRYSRYFQATSCLLASMTLSISEGSTFLSCTIQPKLRPSFWVFRLNAELDRVLGLGAWHVISNDRNVDVIGTPFGVHIYMTVCFLATWGSLPWWHSARSSTTKINYVEVIQPWLLQVQHLEGWSATSWSASGIRADQLALPIRAAVGNLPGNHLLETVLCLYFPAQPPEYAWN